jgi:hypothetical protein
MISATPANAQLVRPSIAPLATAACERFDLFPPPSARPDVVTERQLAACVSDLALELTDDKLKAASPATDAKTKEAQLHSQLLRIYLSYAELKKWRKKWDSDTDLSDPHVALENQFNLLSQKLHQLLDDHGLLRAFSATLLTGFSFTSLGAQQATTSTQTDFSGVDSQATQPTGFISWETVHFFSDDQTKFVPDLSVGGTVGFRPALTLVTIPGSQANTTIGPLGTFQPAFVWDSNIAGNVRLGDVAE